MNLFIRPFKKGALTYDLNNVSNRFRSNEDGAELFSMMVPHHHYNHLHQ